MVDILQSANSDLESLRINNKFYCLLLPCIFHFSKVREYTLRETGPCRIREIRDAHDVTYIRLGIIEQRRCRRVVSTSDDKWTRTTSFYFQRHVISLAFYLAIASSEKFLLSNLFDDIITHMYEVCNV